MTVGTVVCLAFCGSDADEIPVEMKKTVKYSGDNKYVKPVKRKDGKFSNVPLKILKNKVHDT